MAKLGSSSRKNNSIVKLKIVVKKLQKSLLSSKKSNFFVDDYEEFRDSTNVPDDVKEGHVAVLAVDGDEPKRFIVPLNYLTHPTFTRLLEQAAEEYGFDREGALTIPCPPSDLEMILAEQCQKAHGVSGSTVSHVKWTSGNPMVQSY